VLRIEKVFILKSIVLRMSNGEARGSHGSALVSCRHWLHFQWAESVRRLVCCSLDRLGPGGGQAAAAVVCCCSLSVACCGSCD
jgi:hypothetical protein